MILRLKNLGKNMTVTQEPVNPTDIRAFIGLMALSATMKDEHLAARQMFDITFHEIFYCSTMSCQRFDFRINCLRFYDKITRPAAH